MDPENYNSLVHDYTDAELLRDRVLIIRQLGRLNTQLAIIDEERRQRAPQDQEAIIYNFPTGENNGTDFRPSGA